MKLYHTIAFVSALCLACTGVPAAALAEPAAVYADAAETTDVSCFTYVKEDGGISLTGLVGSAPEEIVIPAEIEGLPVTKICKEVFWKKQITSVVVPEGVTTIEPYAFAQNTMLKSVVLPETLTECSHLFYRCSGLESVTLPKKLGHVPRSMFSGCSSLKSIVIPDGYTAIDYCAFEGCTDLAEIEIPASVTEFEGYAFSGTKWLENRIAENPLVIVNNVLVDASEAEGAVTIPDTVTTITECAFINNAAVTSLTIPVSVKRIGNHALDNCIALTALTLPNELEEIGEFAFQNLMITEIAIPDSVKTIGIGAFTGCAQLASVTVPAGVETVRQGTFAGCVGLQSLTLSEGVKTIEESALNGCIALAEIKIPKTTVNFGGMVFQNTPWLAAQRAKNPLVCVNGVLVDGITASGDVTVPEGVAKIGDCAFYENKALTSVAIPDGVSEIGPRAFAQCGALETVQFPKSLKSIGFDSFNYCTALYSAVIPDGVSEIGISAFSNCKLLRSVRIPSALEVIEKTTFQFCSALTRVTVPENVKQIDESAFANCGQLEAIYIENTKCEIADSAKTISGVEDNYTGRIYGYAGSTAEQYAKKYERDFVSLGTPGQPLPPFWGDVNLDDYVDVSDVVLICRFAAEDSDVRINAQGRLNGDVNGSGGLDKEDGIKILRYIAQYITKDELAPKS